VEVVEAEEAEKQKAVDVGARVRPVSRFLQSFGRALAQRLDSDVDGLWAHPLCALDISIVDFWFYAEGTYTSGVAPLNALAGLSVPSTKDSGAKKVTLTMSGRWFGSAALVAISKVEDGKVYRSLLDVAGEVSRALIYYSRETDEFWVYENLKEENGKHYPMKRVLQS
jgi:hypothetical protein